MLFSRLQVAAEENMLGFLEATWLDYERANFESFSDSSLKLTTLLLGLLSSLGFLKRSTVSPAFVDLQANF